MNPARAVLAGSGIGRISGDGVAIKTDAYEKDCFDTRFVQRNDEFGSNLRADAGSCLALFS